MGPQPCCIVYITGGGPPPAELGHKNKLLHTPEQLRELWVAATDSEIFRRPWQPVQHLPPDARRQRLLFTVFSSLLPLHPTAATEATTTTRFALCCLAFCLVVATAAPEAARVAFKVSINLMDYE